MTSQIQKAFAQPYHYKLYCCSTHDTVIIILKWLVWEGECNLGSVVVTLGINVLSVTHFWINLQNLGWLHTSTSLFLASPVDGTTSEKPLCLTLPSGAWSSQCTATSCHPPSWPMSPTFSLADFNVSFLPLSYCLTGCARLLPHYPHRQFNLALPWASLL